MKKPVNFLDEGEYRAWLRGPYKKVMETPYDDLRKKLLKQLRPIKDDNERP